VTRDRKGPTREDIPASARDGEQLPAPEHAEAELLSDDLALLWFPLPAAELPFGLTESEQDIALRVYAGLSNEEIGVERGVSPRTVGNQLEGIYRKLGVSSRVQLVLLLRGAPEPR
jgi:DNA-binding CsgD family transcriptional regulator